MDYSLQGEDQLIEYLKKGNHRAFKELVERNQDAVARGIEGILGECPQAEDVGQEVFIKLYRVLRNDQFKKGSKLETYLTRIAINYFRLEAERSDVG